MSVIGTLASVTLIVLTLMDCFEAILQPRRVTHRFRYARLFYNMTWTVWRFVALRIYSMKARQSFLSVFGPLSLLCLFVTWLFSLILGFAVLHLSLGTSIRVPDEQVNFLTYLYLSGTTLFTLGYGDITPLDAVGRTLAVIEAGLGFAFLAVIISYLPVLSQAFSRREVSISLLDARAGSPPSASQVLLRLARTNNLPAIDAFLFEWERWAAELLESHLSFPVLSYYRSQHDNQSWLAALTTVLDTCAILISEVSSVSSYQAQLTFAMARHAAVDLALVLKTPPLWPGTDRFPESKHQELRDQMLNAGLRLHEQTTRTSKLSDLRGMYEPFVNAIAQRFLFTLPMILPEQAAIDNWQRSAQMPRTPGIGDLPRVGADDEHFG
jgi:hypothetical protein